LTEHYDLIVIGSEKVRRGKQALESIR